MSQRFGSFGKDGGDEVQVATDPFTPVDIK
jgi:hypothetical protein